MALINCKECNKQVSDSALKCPECGVLINKPKRGFFGKLFKWSFVLFNILMIVWMFTFFANTGEVMSTTNNEYEQAGAALGATLGTGMLLTFWAIGDVILGLLVLLTRPKAH